LSTSSHHWRKLVGVEFPGVRWTALSRPSFGGMAQTGGELIAARAAQGVGGAILAPATLSLLTAEFTEHHERRRALGVWSATAASGAAGGLFLGGVLTSLLGWRWVLFVNVPIGVAFIVAALLSLTESTGRLASRSLDLAGAATLTGGMAILVYGIVSTGTHPWGSSRTITTLAVAAAMLILFVLIEARFAPSPIVPLRTFRRRSLSVANVLSATVGAPGRTQLVPADEGQIPDEIYRP